MFPTAVSTPPRQRNSQPRFGAVDSVGTVPRRCRVRQVGRPYAGLEGPALGLARLAPEGPVMPDPSSVASPPPDLARKAVAEAVGTFILVFFAVGAAVVGL